jgi:hypothetical protein
MGDNPAVDQLRAADLAKLPLFSGIKGTDTFTCEQWLERIDRARLASNWTDAQTMSFIFNALRSSALAWFDTLKRSGVDRNNYAQFRVAFLSAYSSTRTPRTTVVHLADLQQGQSESVVNFYTRVVKAVDELEALVPVAGIPLPAVAYPPVMTEIPAFAALLPAAKNAAAAALITHGATYAFNHMALNLFISNLRPILRDELLKAFPASLYEAFHQASALEKIHMDPKKPDAAFMTPVDAPPPVTPPPDDSHADDIDIKIDALNSRIKQLHACHTQPFRPNANNSAPRQSGGASQPFRSRPPQQRSGAPRRAANKDDQCRYCLKMGHFQRECFSRRRENAPMVGADGKPYRTAVIDQVVPAPQQQQQQQQPQQQQPQQQQQQQYQYIRNMQEFPNVPNYTFPYISQDFQ